MGKPPIGSVLLAKFPFSDLSGQKLRPVLLLGYAEFDNLIVCQITSQPYASRLASKITHANFQHGQLPIDSFVRPDKLFTTDPSLITRSVGQLKPQTMTLISQQVKSLLTYPPTDYSP